MTSFPMNSSPKMNSSVATGASSRKVGLAIVLLHEARTFIWGVMSYIRPSAGSHDSSAIVAEAAVIATLGALAGYVVYALILAIGAYTIRAQTGVVLDAFTGHRVLWITPLAMMALGALAGFLPALKAYATDVASNLVPAS